MHSLHTYLVQITYDVLIVLVVSYQIPATRTAVRTTSVVKIDMYSTWYVDLSLYLVPRAVLTLRTYQAQELIQIFHRPCDHSGFPNVFINRHFYDILLSWLCDARINRPKRLRKLLFLKYPPADG